MNKLLTTAMAAITAAGAVSATATPASADPYRGGHYRHHRGGSDKAAVAAFAGIAGLALGAALSSKGGGRDGYSSNYAYRDAPYRNGYAYDPAYDGYSGDYYAYAAPPRVCITRERVYDPYIGRRVTIQREYRC